MAWAFGACAPTRAPSSVEPEPDAGPLLAPDTVADAAPPSADIASDSDAAQGDAAATPSADGGPPAPPHVATPYVPGPCAADLLILSAVQSKCGCAPTEWRASYDKEPLCAWDEALDPARARADVRARFVSPPGKIKGGSSTVLEVRWENTGTEPVKLRFFRDYVLEAATLNADGSPVKEEVDPSCHEAGALGLASFSLVTLPPGGALKSTLKWHARHPRRYGRAGWGCYTGPGSPLAKGTYRVRLLDSDGAPVDKPAAPVTLDIDVE